MATYTLFLFTFLALVTFQTFASDPCPLQDFCVAENSTVFVNGLVCKNPNDAKSEDFYFSGLDKAVDTGKNQGSNVTLVNVQKIAGLNTLAISIARLVFAPDNGLNPPHTHPRTTEVLTVIEGTLYICWFCDISPKLQALFQGVEQGDVFVFPKGLIHFQFNIGACRAVAFAGLSSQNPGLATVAKSVFGSNPPISDDVLAKAFQLDKKIVDWLQTQF